MKHLEIWRQIHYLFLTKRGAERRAKWVYHPVVREARSVREPRVGPSELQTRSSHLYLYISDGVRHDVIQFDVTAHFCF